MKIPKVLQHLKLWLFALALFAGNSEKLNAWVYPEHREILARAIQMLPQTHRASLERLWAQGRLAAPNRLSQFTIDSAATERPDRLDYAAWAAIAGDHASSSEELLKTVLNEAWILDVARIAARLNTDLKTLKKREWRLNATRVSDILLQRADPDYATRAGKNNAHFLLPLLTPSEPLLDYLFECVDSLAEPNALGIYLWYHHRALLKLRTAIQPHHTEEHRRQAILSAFADEAFAIHFIQDIYAAGHTVGSRGNPSLRKGTHDFYNENGLQTNTWKGEKIILTGDAWMREDDRNLAASVVTKSLIQFLEAAEPESEPLGNTESNDLNAIEFNVGEARSMPLHTLDAAVLKKVISILEETPVPGLSKGIGELPRFRAEIGPFIGISPSAGISVINGAFGQNQVKLGAVSSLEFSVRVGVGLDGVLNESSDGLAFLQAGWRQDASSSTGVVDAENIQRFGSILSAIPGRTSYSFRLRLPYFLFPADLLISAPFLFLFSPKTLQEMGTTAINGGLIPLQNGFMTPIGRFQFMLGREASVYFFGRSAQRDALISPKFDENGNEETTILGYRSTLVEFPFLEYRPFRNFSTDQSAGLMMQFYFGWDFPHQVEDLVDSNLAPPELKSYWFVGVRLVFNWRAYF
ncbi:MAG: hypothetical protein SFU91_14845 [Chloroherpetonaceae bacterium]|nr:hypothetical protein [Chloroherpetonaceae bacterium]